MVSSRCVCDAVGVDDVVAVVVDIDVGGAEKSHWNLRRCPKNALLEFW